MAKHFSNYLLTSCGLTLCILLELIHISHNILSDVDILIATTEITHFLKEWKKYEVASKHVKVISNLD